MKLTKTTKTKATKPVVVFTCNLVKKYPGLPKDWKVGMEFIQLDDMWIPKENYTPIKLDKETIDTEFYKINIVCLNSIKVGDKVIYDKVLHTVQGITSDKTLSIKEDSGRSYVRAKSVNVDLVTTVKTHWFLSSKGVVQSDLDYKLDEFALAWRKKTSNYFETKEAAQEAKTKILC